jgi:beta-hydroxyacyl-ACP dehydratase FabZ
MIEIDDIKNVLPHRYPFLLVDRVIELQKGSHAKGIKNVTVNEPHFVGHFPNHNVMPGVLIIEAMAQLSGILAANTLESSSRAPSLVYLVGIDYARFRKIVTPGDTIILETKILKHKGTMWKFETLAKVKEKIAASALISAVTEQKQT